MQTRKLRISLEALAGMLAIGEREGFTIDSGLPPDAKIVSVRHLKEAGALELTLKGSFTGSGDYVDVYAAMRYEGKTVHGTLANPFLSIAVGSLATDNCPYVQVSQAETAPSEKWRIVSYDGHAGYRLWTGEKWIKFDASKADCMEGGKTWGSVAEALAAAKKLVEDSRIINKTGELTGFKRKRKRTIPEVDACANPLSGTK